MSRVVPPILWFFCIFLSWRTSVVSPITANVQSGVKWGGAVLFVLGFLASANAVRQFLKSKTEIHTFRKPIHLSTDGLFGLSRNPIYLGQTTALVGLSFFLGSPLSVITAVIFWAACNFHYIPFEENNLESVFGADYVNYKQSVRRWI